MEVGRGLESSVSPAGREEFREGAPAGVGRSPVGASAGAVPVARGPDDGEADDGEAGDGEAGDGATPEEGSGEGDTTRVGTRPSEVGAACRSGDTVGDTAGGTGSGPRGRSRFDTIRADTDTAVRIVNPVVTRRRRRK
jgi:hypothetical protein